MGREKHVARSVPVLSLVLGFQLLFERLPIAFSRQRVALRFETAFATDGRATMLALRDCHGIDWLRVAN